MPRHRQTEPEPLPPRQYPPVKVPTFWFDKPVLWFANLEAQFVIAGIVDDDTRFAYVLANLDSKAAETAEDVVTLPPAANKYLALKTTLISRLSASQEARFRTLLAREEIGDRTPSQFLRYMRGLAGPGFPDDLLRSLWSSRLPLHHREILAVSSAASLDELTLLADKISEISPTPQVSGVDSSPDLTTLATQIASLTSTVATLIADRDLVRANRSRVPMRTAASSSDHTRSSSTTIDGSDLCWYHRKYGARARRCLEPCAFLVKNAGGGQ
jgi:hypothetical protein